MKLSGRKVSEAEHKCSFCPRCFYKPEDRDQHEYSCGKRRPEEPADPPRARPREIKKAEKPQKKEKDGSWSRVTWRDGVNGLQKGILPQTSSCGQCQAEQTRLRQCGQENKRSAPRIRFRVLFVSHEGFCGTPPNLLVFGVHAARGSVPPVSLRCPSGVPPGPSDAARPSFSWGPFATVQHLSAVPPPLSRHCPATATFTENTAHDLFYFLIVCVYLLIHNIYVYMDIYIYTWLQARTEG